jgi:ubiquinone biosynthesis protein
LKANNVNLEFLAEKGLDLFFQQVFENNFFHADMHGGNVFVDIKDPNKPSYICVDFGIMGSLSKKDKLYIAENLVAFFNRDYDKVAALHIESNWLPSHTRVDQFAAAIRTVSEPIFALPLSEISFGKLLLSLFKTARKFDVEIQPQLILLQKTLLNVESLARTLHPQLNLWATAKPYLEGWVKDQFAWHKLFDKTKQQLPIWLTSYTDLPQIIYKSLSHPALPQEPKLIYVNKKTGRLVSFVLGIICTFCVLLALSYWHLLTLS